MTRSLPRLALAGVTALVVAVALGGCAAGGSPTAPIRVGWSGALPPLDPAASSSFGSFAFLTQIHPSLLAIDEEQVDPTLEIAESAEWTDDGVYTVVLKPGLEFANGHDLTASDVKFSLERQLALQSEDGAWRALARLDSIAIVDDATIAFHFGATIDTGFPYVLAGPAGLVLDEESFFADELTPDEEILEAHAFGGPFTIESRSGDQVLLRPFAGFGGPSRAGAAIDVRAGSGADFARELGDGSIDVLAGPLPIETLDALADDETVELARAGSGRVHVLAFDLANMPFGSRTETADTAKAAAVRVAIGELVDREAIADAIGPRWVDPAYGYVPHGVPGSADVLVDGHGDGDGGPDAEAAEAALTAAGITTVVELKVHVDPAQLGTAGLTELALIAKQLDGSELFSVDIVETDADGLAAALLAGETDAVFTSVYPITRDPRDYLEPYRSTGLLAPGYADAELDKLLDRITTEADPEARTATLLDAQTELARSLPAIPTMQTVRVVFVRGTISGYDLVDSVPVDLGRLRR